MRKVSNILWGLLLVVVGVILGLNLFGVTDINLFFDGWWTLFIIIPCLGSLFIGTHKISNLIGVAIGVILLLACQDILQFRVVWKLILPVAIVLVGLKLIFPGTFSRKGREVRQRLAQEASTHPLKEYCATFSSQHVCPENEIFEGASLTAVFGGIKCDLRSAILQQDVTVNICSVFGGVDLLLPPHVNAQVISSTCIFGGISNKKRGDGTNSVAGEPTAVTVYVTGTCLFGGADIK